MREIRTSSAPPSPALAAASDELRPSNHSLGVSNAECSSARLFRCDHGLRLRRRACCRRCLHRRESVGAPSEASTSSSRSSSHSKESAGRGSQHGNAGGSSPNAAKSSGRRTMRMLKHALVFRSPLAAGVAAEAAFASSAGPQYTPSEHGAEARRGRQKQIHPRSEHVVARWLSGPVARRPEPLHGLQSPGREGRPRHLGRRASERARPVGGGPSTSRSRSIRPLTTSAPRRSRAAASCS